MRYLFLLLLASVFCLPGGGAQTQAALDHLIGQLDLTNDLQTGYLLNKAGSTGTLEYDGPRMVDVIEYSTTHDLLARVHVSGPEAPFVAPEVLETAINDANTPGTPLPVSIILHEYDYMKPNAIDDGLLSVQNGQLHDETGPNESPYETKTVFLMSVLEPAISNANTPGTPPISIILHEYDRIKPDAVDNNLLTVTNGRP